MTHREARDVIAAMAAVPAYDLRTPQQVFMDALKDGLLITTSWDEGHIIACAENGIAHFDATVVGAVGDNPLSVIVLAIEQHYENVATIVNREQ